MYPLTIQSIVIYRFTKTKTFVVFPTLFKELGFKKQNSALPLKSK